MLGFFYLIGLQSQCCSCSWFDDLRNPLEGQARHERYSDDVPFVLSLSKDERPL